MIRVLVAALAIAFHAVAQEAPTPEQCRTRDEGALTVTFGEKTYRVASEACREQFLSDPERYAQLFDALEELEAAGKPVAPPATASLVPS